MRDQRSACDSSGRIFNLDYRTGLVQVSLVNVDRFDRVTLEFRSGTIDESVLDDLVRFILGRSSGFLRRAPLAGIPGRPDITARRHRTPAIDKTGETFRQGYPKGVPFTDYRALSSNSSRWQ